MGASAKQPMMRRCRRAQHHNQHTGDPDPARGAVPPRAHQSARRPREILSGKRHRRPGRLHHRRRKSRRLRPGDDQEADPGDRRFPEPPARSCRLTICLAKPIQTKPLRSTERHHYRFDSFVRPCLWPVVRSALHRRNRQQTC